MRLKTLPLIGLMALGVCSCDTQAGTTNAWCDDAYRIYIDGSLTYDSNSRKNLAYMEDTNSRRYYAVLYVRYETEASVGTGWVSYQVTDMYVNHAYQIERRAKL